MHFPFNSASPSHVPIVPSESSPKSFIWIGTGALDKRLGQWSSLGFCSTNILMFGPYCCLFVLVQVLQHFLVFILLVYYRPLGSSSHSFNLSSGLVPIPNKWTELLRFGIFGNPQSSFGCEKWKTITLKFKSGSQSNFSMSGGFCVFSPLVPISDWKGISVCQRQPGIMELKSFLFAPWLLIKLVLCLVFIGPRCPWSDLWICLSQTE